MISHPSITKAPHQLAIVQNVQLDCLGKVGLYKIMSVSVAISSGDMLNTGDSSPKAIDVGHKGTDHRWGTVYL